MAPSNVSPEERQLAEARARLREHFGTSQVEALEDWFDAKVAVAELDAMRMEAAKRDH